jgi:hypothetical protein
MEGVSGSVAGVVLGPSTDDGQALSGKFCAAAGKTKIGTDNNTVNSQHQEPKRIRPSSLYRAQRFG